MVSLEELSMIRRVCSGGKRGCQLQPGGNLCSEGEVSVRATATRIWSARTCCSAAPTTASPTTLKVATCGTQKTTAVSRFISLKFNHLFLLFNNHLWFILFSMPLF